MQNYFLKGQRVETYWLYKRNRIYTIFFTYKEIPVSAFLDNICSLFAFYLINLFSQLFWHVINMLFKVYNKMTLHKYIAKWSPQ